MKKVLTAITVTGLAAATSFATGSASATFDFATAHVFRGATVVDELVFQPNAEISGFGLPEEAGEIAFGAWGSVAPFGDGVYDNYYETDWYVSYMLPELAENLDLSISYTAYQYAPLDQEKEINLGAGYLLGDFGIGSTLNIMIDSLSTLTQDQVYWDLFADYTFDINEKVNIDVYALIGIMIKQGDGWDFVGRNAGVNHFELGGDVSYDLSENWDLGAGLFYVGQGDSAVLPDGAHDKGLVLTFGVGYQL